MKPPTQQHPHFVSSQIRCSVLPDSLRDLARRFIRAYQHSDWEHADELIELAHVLDADPAGQAFIASFLSTVPA